MIFLVNFSTTNSQVANDNCLAAKSLLEKQGISDIPKSPQKGESRANYLSNLIFNLLKFNPSKTSSIKNVREKTI